MKSEVWRRVWLVARYESKVIRRDFLFWVLLFLVLGVITFHQAVKQGNFGGSSAWCLVSTSAAVPLMNAYLFNIFQSFILIFICMNLWQRERWADSSQVIYVRPGENWEYMLGKAWGTGRVFIGLNVISLGIAFLINLFASSAPVSLGLYFYYFFTLTLPSLCCVLGFSLFVIRLVRFPVLALFILSGGIILLLLVLPGCCYGTFDMLGIALPNFFSGMAGHPFMGPFLMQRFGVVLCGGGFMLLASGCMRRLYNGRREKIMVFVLSGVLFLCGGGLFGKYYTYYSGADARRGVYRDVFLKYDRMKCLHAERHEIVYNQRGCDLRMSSRLTLTNPLDRRVDSVILYLNPGLKIEKLVAGGEEIAYVREHQVVVIPRGLESLDTLHLYMEYGGRVDEQVCYVDKPLGVSGQFGDTPFRFGQRCSYTERDYTLLLPEILWYPMTIPPTNIRRPEFTRLDFTSYVLDLPREERRTTITQGISHYSKDRVVYYSTEKYPGLTLCIGDYVSESLWMDTYAVELYYIRGHNFFESFSLLNKDKLKDIIYYWTKIKFLKYPYERLCLVESPISFFTPVRKWKETSDFIQPGIVFLPEQGTTLGRIKGFAFYSREEREKNSKARLVADQRNRLNNLIEGTLFQRTVAAYKGDSPLDRLFAILGETTRDEGETSRDVRPLFYDYSCSFISPEIPIADHALRMMEMEQDNAYGWGFINPFKNGISENEYFFKHSLEYALGDTTLSPAFRERLISMKTLDLYTYLQAHIPDNRLFRFWTDFRKRNRYKWLKLEEFNEELEQKYGFDIRPFWEKWYRDTIMPCFEICDVSFKRVEPRPEELKSVYKIHFKVRNVGKAGGAITTVIPQGFMNSCNNYFWIPAGACKEVKLAFTSPAQFINISTGIAANLPNAFEFQDQRSGPMPLTADRQMGLFDVSPEAFEEQPGVIVVDNEDPGFRLIEKEGRETWASRRMKRERYRDAIKVLMNLRSSSGWQRMVSRYCYGKAVRSAYVKAMGDGSAKAEWTAEIPEDGVYEIFARYAKYSGYSGIKLQTMAAFWKLHYTIECKDEISEVVFDMGDREFLKMKMGDELWFPLGEFKLPAGQAKVTLDDRGQREDDFQQMIFADAVKFVKKK